MPISPSSPLDQSDGAIVKVTTQSHCDHVLLAETNLVCHSTSIVTREDLPLSYLRQDPDNFTTVSLISNSWLCFFALTQERIQLILLNCRKESNRISYAWKWHCFYNFVLDNVTWVSEHRLQRVLAFLLSLVGSGLSHSSVWVTWP